MNIDRFTRSLGLQRLVGRRLSDLEQMGLAAWELRQTSGFRVSKTKRHREGEPWEMEEPPQPPDDGPPGSPGASPDQPDTSSYLIGSVAVGIVFVSGTAAKLTLTEDQRIKVFAEVQEGLARLPQHEPLANVSFVYDSQTVTLNLEADPSLHGYESREAHWRDPALAQLGFIPGIGGVRAYANKIRSNLNTDWTMVAFFTLYPVAHFAYAIKPYVVMHYENGSWTPDNIDRVFQHETGHIFGCPDEYPKSRCQCDELFGFLQEPNGNCEICSGPGFVECLMSHNIDVLCRHTPVHLGWRDSRGDGVLDPLR